MGGYHYIDDAIKIDFTIPTWLQEVLDIAENADMEDNYAVYEPTAEHIDICGKNLYANGALSESQWRTLVRRYQV